MARFSAVRTWSVVVLAIANVAADVFTTLRVVSTSLGLLVLDLGWASISCRNASISARSLARVFLSPALRSRANCSRDSTASVYADSSRIFFAAIALDATTKANINGIQIAHAWKAAAI